jgi:hypothetical protein
MIPRKETLLPAAFPAAGLAFFKRVEAADVEFSCVKSLHVVGRYDSQLNRPPISFALNQHQIQLAPEILGGFGPDQQYALSAQAGKLLPQADDGVGRPKIVRNDYC